MASKLSMARHSRNAANCRILLEWKKDLTYIVFDTETTGLKMDRDRIVELAARKYLVKANSSHPQKIDEIDIYIRPPFQMDENAIQVHGITNEYLYDKPYERDVFDKIQKFFGPCPILVGYNVNFDIGMLNALYKRQKANLNINGVLDVLEMIRDCVKPDESADKKLSTMAHEFGVDAGLSFHNALDDTEATNRLLLCCHQIYKDKNLPNTNTKTQMRIYGYNYWKGYSKKQAGIWVYTDCGKLYFNTYDKWWKSSEIDLNRVNVDQLEDWIIGDLGVSRSDFYKLTEKKFEQAKEHV